MNFSKHIIFIAGPTAVGKSDVAVNIARYFQGEVVSCDAMQVYKEVSIVNNKPEIEARCAVPHHLIDIVSIEENYDVARFFNQASDVIECIWRRGKVPIVVGGTSMYMQVLIDGIFNYPETNPQIRQSLMRQIEDKGNEALYSRLQRIDPEAALKIHVNDTKRIVRALEVFMSGGLLISQLQKEREGLWDKYPVSVFVLNLERKYLYERINLRVEKMFDTGVLDEIGLLENKKLSRTAASMIGIPEIQGFLNKKYSLDEARELMKKNTRNFAKRQLTWFRKDPRWKWIDVQFGMSGETVAKRIIKHYESEKI